MPACPECAEAVSADAPKCAWCGANLRRPPEEDRSSEVGPVGVFVVAGLLVGFAAGSPFEGWSQAAFPLAFAGLGAGVWWVLDGPLAHLRQEGEGSALTPAAPESESEPESEPAPESEATPSTSAESEGSDGPTQTPSS